MSQLQEHNVSEHAIGGFEPTHEKGQDRAQNGRCIIMHFGRFMGHRWEMQYNAAGGAMGASGKTHSGAIGNGGVRGEGQTAAHNKPSGARRKKKYIYIYILV